MNNPFEQIEDLIKNLTFKVEQLETKINGDKKWLNVSETAQSWIFKRLYP